MIWISLTIAFALIIIAVLIIISFNAGIRIVLDLNRDMAIAEILLFEKLRVFRVKIFLHGNSAYYKPLKKPYRMIKSEDIESESRDDEEQKNENGAELNLSALYESLNRRKMNLKTLRVYLYIGADDSYITGLICGVAEITTGLIIKTIENVAVCADSTLLIKPNFKSEELTLDILASASMSEILKLGFKALKAKRKESKAEEKI